MKAVVMAGGEGSRLRPLTSNLPKPMVPIVNRPCMEYILVLLKNFGITEIVATLQFLPQMIKNYFSDGSSLGVNMSYSIEDSPLGTAGSVKNAEDHLKERFIVISGDALTDINLSEAVKFHADKGSMATIILKRVKNPLEFGVIVTTEDGKIERFLEKPTWGQVFSDTVNTGIYILEPEIFEMIPKNQIFDFSKDLFPMMLDKKMPLYGYVGEGYWADIGNIEQYKQANFDVLQRKINVEPPGIKMLEDIWIGEGASIHPSVNLQGPTVIGQYSEIRAGVDLKEFTILGDNVVVDNYSHTHRIIVMSNSYIGKHSNIHNGIIGKNCDVKNSVRIAPGAAIGDDCLIGDNAIINNDVKIYPFKEVEDGATINQSIIWETRGARTLFGKQGITGLINIDITPNKAMRIAQAWATLLDKGSAVIASRDSNRASRMIKNAIIAGLNSSGISCRDLRVAPTPVNRYRVQTTRCLGGVHVRISPFDPQTIQILVFDKNGIDVSESIQRNIERYFFREDFRRGYFNEIGEIIYPPRTSEYYTNGLLNLIDKELINEKKFKVVVDYSYGSSSLILPYIFSKMDVDVISFNAYANEEKTTITTEELELSKSSVTKAINTFKADFGVIIDSASEKMIVFDETGAQISFDDVLMMMIKLVCLYEKKKGKIAIPLSISTKLDMLVEEFGRKLIWTKVSSYSLMEAAIRPDVVFVGAQGGGYIFSQFTKSYDAIFSLFKLLEYLAKSEMKISQIVKSLPNYYLSIDKVRCPFEKKGLVMRKIMEDYADEDIELIDGVKVYINGRKEWILIIPDTSEPYVRLYSEGSTKKKADAILKDLVVKIEGIIKD